MPLDQGKQYAAGSREGVDPTEMVLLLESLVAAGAKRAFGHRPPSYSSCVEYGGCFFQATLRLPFGRPSYVPVSCVKGKGERDHPRNENGIIRKPTELLGPESCESSRPEPELDGSGADGQGLKKRTCT